jgi:hypothetical protein
MAISDRIKEAIDKLHQGGPVNALIQTSIAIDATAKKKYPSQKPTQRCKNFLRNQQAFITKVAFGKLEIQGDIYFDSSSSNSGKKGKTLEDVLYHLVRCSLLHEGEMPKEVEIVHESTFGMTGDGKVIFSVLMIWAMIWSVVGSKVNEAERLPDVYTASIGGITLKLNDLWGKKEKIYELVYEHNKS